MRNADKIIIGLLIALIIGAGYFQYLADELNKRMDEIKTIDQKLVDRVEDQFADSLRQYNLRFIGRGKHIRKAQADIIDNTDLIIKNTDSLLSLIDDVDFKLDNLDPAIHDFVTKHKIDKLEDLSIKDKRGIYFAKFPLLPFSSTDIRAKISRKESIKNLVTPEVSNFINKTASYKSDGHKI